MSMMQTHFGFGQSRPSSTQTQAQMQVQRQVIKRQMLLDQLDKTFVVLKNYFDAIEQGDRVTMGAQNVAAASVMNALRAQVMLAKMRKDKEVLVMGLAKVSDFSGQSRKIYGRSRSVGEVERNYTGLMNAILCGHNVDELPCVAMPSDGAVVNEAVSGVLGASHDAQNLVKQIERRPHETARDQQRLLEYGMRQCLDERREATVDVRFEVEALSGHFTSEKEFYDTSKSARKEGADRIDLGTDGAPLLGFGDGCGDDHDHDHDMEEGNASGHQERLLLRVGEGHFEQVELISVQGPRAQVRRNDGATCVVPMAALGKLA